MTVIQLPTAFPVRDSVAGEVRAEMSRRKVRVATLSREIGNSTAYWWRRVNGETAFDVDDLGAVANLLGCSIVDFFGRVGPTPPGNVAASGPLAQSVEQRTFNPKSPILAAVA